MRSLLFSACLLGCLTTSQAFGADRIVVQYTKTDLASEAALGALYEKIAAAATTLCRDEADPFTTDVKSFTLECTQLSVKKAVFATKSPALIAYSEALSRNQNAATRSKILASR